MKISFLSTALALCLGFICTQAEANPSFKVLYKDTTTGRLVYTSDFEGNRVLDFSHAGYKGGNYVNAAGALARFPATSELVAAGLPVVNVALDGGSTECTAGNDNTLCIQNAIDTVSTYPLITSGLATGFRGVVQLAAGNYTLAGLGNSTNALNALLNVSTSGVILAGAGSNSTTLMVSGSTPTPSADTSSIVRVGGNSADTITWTVTNPVTAAVQNQFIPAGATEFRVKSTGGYIPQQGDNIILLVPTNNYWSSFAFFGGIGAGATLPPNTTALWWGEPGKNVGPINSTYNLSAGYATTDLSDVKYNRTVTNVVDLGGGNYGVSIHSPIFAAINNGNASPTNQPYLSTDQAYIYPFNAEDAQYKNNIGVQGLNIVIPSSDGSINGTDKELAAQGIRVSQAQDVWVHDVIVSGYRSSAFNLGSTHQVTISYSKAINKNSALVNVASRAYAFTTTQATNNVLFDSCEAEMPRHGFIPNTPSSSGIVFLNGKTTLDFLDNEGHQKWSQGILFDKITTTKASFGNRFVSGTSHGWSAVNSVIWGIDLGTTGTVGMQQPPQGQNYCLNCTGGAKVWGQAGCGGSPCTLASGNPAYFENNSSIPNSTLTSLYLSQLNERQTTGGIPLSAPAKLTVTLVSGKPQLAWDTLMGSSVGGGNGFFIERSNDGGITYTTINSTPIAATATTYSDLAGTANSLYRMYSTKNIVKGSTTTVARSAYSNLAPIAGRYVKLVMHTTSNNLNGGNIILNDFQVFSKATPTTKTAPTSVTVYNYSNNTYTTTLAKNFKCNPLFGAKNTVACAFDSSTSTYFATMASPWISVAPATTQQEFYVDLGSVLALSSIRLTFGNPYSPEYYIYVSSDTTTTKNWTRIYGTIFGTTGTNTINF